MGIKGVAVVQISLNRGRATRPRSDTERVVDRSEQFNPLTPTVAIWVDL